MDPKEFVSDLAGEVRRTPEGYWTFIPSPLPPTVDYSPELALLLSQADAALSELSGLGRYLPNPDLLIAPYVKREAVASSRIEGTQAGLADLLLDEIDPKRTPTDSDVREVRNYIAALNEGLRELGRLPLSGRLVRELHRVLMQDVRGHDKTPGEYRRTQNWIGAPGSTLATAAYVPPPPDPEMHACLRQWEDFINQRDQMPDLVQCALMHERFEAIHPFLDGNGRVGRLLVTLFLIERGRLSKPLLYLSSYIEQHRREYYQGLQRVRTHADWDGWLRYFLLAVRDTARSAIRQSQRILALRDDYRARLDKQLREQALLDDLFINPYVTVAHAAERLGVAPATARKSLKRLEDIGALTEATGREWGRVWVAQPILAALADEAGADATAARTAPGQ